MSESIWFDAANITIDGLNARCERTMNTAIGLFFTTIDEQSLTAKMVVSEQNCQPLGMLNGGASMAAIEIVGSLAANLVLDRSERVAVGQNIQGSHFRPAFIGEEVWATGKPLHLGSRSQIWEVELTNSRNKLICKGSITMAVIPNPKKNG